ncbi:MAG: heme-binding protein, partial [Verrucomicrobiota bacterium]|nr:heme-binding protein [Verrucomicrobiota bacterium]
MRHVFKLFFLPSFFFALAAPLCAQVPEWIWSSKTAAENEVRYFRKTFTLDANVAKAVLSAAGDDEAQIFLNGKMVLDTKTWEKAIRADVTGELRKGENVLAVRGKNRGAGQAAVIALLEINLGKRNKQFIGTDANWLYSSQEFSGWEKNKFDDSSWSKAVSLGKLGVKPWGDVMQLPQATPAEELTLLPGFKVELLRSAEPGEGSWVSMTTDPKGRLIISPQQGTNNLLRITLSEGKISRLEKIDLPVGSSMGMLYAFDSLYVNGSGPEGLGIYRLRDTNGDDKFDSINLVRKIERAEGEHGSHALLLGPDKKIYVINGNFVKIPADISPNSPHKNYAEDQLLPRANDGNGFGNGVQPPGGSVWRMDADGKNCELFA